MKNNVSRIAVTLVTLSALIGPAARAEGHPCSARELKGSYALKMDGSIPPGPVNFAAVGIQTFDAAGNFATTNTISVGGAIGLRYSFSGIYTLDPDCTGVMTAHFPGGITSTSYFVMLPNGKQLYTIGADPGSVTTGVFTRMSPDYDR